MSFPGLVNVLTRQMDPRKEKVLLAVSMDGVEELHGYARILLSKMGWIHGRVFDEGDLTHPDLVDWKDLPDNRKELAELELQVLEKKHG